DGRKLSLNLCISYSSRAEIARAARLLAEEVLQGTTQLHDVDEDSVREKLYTAPWRDPDLLIRTSGEQRLSNFLLCQLAYTELYITPVWVTVFGCLYASALLSFVVPIRHGAHSDAHQLASTALVGLPLAVTWICDTCAMAAGALFGGPKLAPVLSPHKTWAGAAGG